MEKTDAVSKLKKAGYQVQFDSSVVTVILPVKANVSQELKKLRACLAEIGYDASFGIKQAKDADRVEEQNEELADSEAMEAEFQEEESSFQELEIGEQFSLEDFGL